MAATSASPPPCPYDSTPSRPPRPRAAAPALGGPSAPDTEFEAHAGGLTRRVRDLVRPPARAGRGDGPGPRTPPNGPSPKICASTMLPRLRHPHEGKFLGLLRIHVVPDSQMPLYVFLTHQLPTGTWRPEARPASSTRPKSIFIDKVPSTFSAPRRKSPSCSASRACS